MMEMWTEPEKNRVRREKPIETGSESEAIQQTLKTGGKLRWPR